MVEFFDAMPDGAPDIGRIIRSVSAAFNVSASAITGASRACHIVSARHAVALLAHYKRGLASTVIGRHLKKDHSTICVAIQRATRRIGSDMAYAQNVQRAWIMACSDTDSMIRIEHERGLKRAEARMREELTNLQASMMFRDTSSDFLSCGCWTANQLRSMDRAFGLALRLGGGGMTYGDVDQREAA